MKKIYFPVLFAVVTCICSCSDDPAADQGPLTLHFDNVVGTTNLELNTAAMAYTNAEGESYKLTRLTYYVSNIQIKKADGTYYIDPIKSDGSAGYYLVDEEDGESQDVTLENIPAGDYTEVTFTIGVDGSQVDQGAQTGALDPAHGLFWSWNSGYVFLAIEGASPASTEADNVFQFHVGGYKDEVASNQVNNLKTITLTFNGDVAPVRASHEPEVHLLFDVDKFLNGTGEKVTFTTSASRHSPKACQDLASNMEGSFFVDHVHAN